MILMRLSQVIAVMRYELLLLRRQRLLTGVMLSLIALPLVMYVLFGQSNVAEVQRTWITSGGIPTAAALQVTTRYVITYSMMTVYMIALLVLPVISADGIAKDRQHGVRELLDSLPLTTGAYLAGKVLGWWASVAIGLLGAMAIVGVGLWLVIGPYHVDQYVLTWVTLSGGIGLVNSALSLLLAAGQPTRRRAIIVGVVCAAVYLYANITLIGQPGILWNVLSPGRQAISFYFLAKALIDQAPEVAATPQDVLWSVAGGVLEVAAVWWAVWWWMKRQA